MDKSRFFYTLNGMPFDAGAKGQRPGYQILRYRDGGENLQQRQNETNAAFLQRFKKNKSSFDASSEISAFGVDLTDAGKHPEILKDAIKKGQRLILVVGYYIIDAKTDGGKGSISESNHKALTVSQFKREEIYQVGFKMGVCGKAAKGLCPCQPR